jgi:predicted HicB family RNase H-like nuclease
MLKNDYYTYRVTWSVEDNEYLGLCSEFPSLSWLSTNQDDALKGIRQVVADVVRDMQTNGEEIPEPLSTKQFSGRFMIRIPPELHRQLAIQAAESGISLNRLASVRLSRPK